MLDDLKWYIPKVAPVAKPLTAEESLLAAAKWIEEHGWSATGYEQDGDRFCPIEAIAAVTDHQQAAIDLLMDHIRRIEPIGITYWNERASEDEVIAAMRAAAKGRK
jgi:hypothetical protein